MRMNLELYTEAYLRFIVRIIKKNLLFIGILLLTPPLMSQDLKSSDTYQLFYSSISHKTGYMESKTRKVLIPAVYDTLIALSSDSLLFFKGDTAGFINLSGKRIFTFPAPCKAAGRFKNNRALCIISLPHGKLPIKPGTYRKRILHNKYVWVDNKGQIIGNAVFGKVAPFENGKALALNDGTIFLIDSNLKHIKCMERYDYYSYFDKGYAVICDGKKKFGIVDSNNKIVAPVIYNDIYLRGPKHQRNAFSNSSCGFTLYDDKGKEFTTNCMHYVPDIENGVVFAVKGDSSLQIALSTKKPPIISKYGVILSDQVLSPVTLKTTKVVKYRMRVRLYLTERGYGRKERKYKDRLKTNSGTYYVGKRHKLIDYDRESGSGGYIGPFLSHIGNFLDNVYILFGGRNEKINVPFYGLKSAIDQKGLLPMNYTSIDTLKKDVYLVQKFNKKAIYFRKLNQLTSFNWDDVEFNPTTEMIALTRGDSACLMNYKGKIMIKMMRGSIRIYTNANFADIENGKGRFHLDANFDLDTMDKLYNKFSFIRGIGISNTQTNYYRRQYYINSKGEVISKGYALLAPFFNRISFAGNGRGKWAMMDTTGRQITPFKFLNVFCYHSNQEIPYFKYVNDYFLRFYKPVFFHKTDSSNKKNNFLKFEAYPLRAICKEGSYFYDTLGKQLNQMPYDLVKFQWFDTYHLAVLGRKDKRGKLVFSIVDRDIHEFTPLRYTSFEIDNFHPSREQDYIVVTTDTKGVTKRRSFDEWLKELNRN